MRKTIAGVIAGCAPRASPARRWRRKKLTVWWVKGFYKSEDDALFAAIKKYEAKHTSVKVELSQYPVQDMIPKTVAALDSGSPPDVAYADVYDFQVTGKWAFDGKLEDISSVIDADAAPASRRTRSRPPSSTTTRTKKRAYYAFPIKQQTMHIEYWLDMLADGRLQGVGHPDHLEGLLELLVRQGPAGLPRRRPATAPSASASRWASTRATRSIRS